MESISEKNLNLTPLINNLSILFQILDDYSNLQSTKYHQSKKKKKKLFLTFYFFSKK